jgi:hypothetical protein
LKRKNPPGEIFGRQARAKAARFPSARAKAFAKSLAKSLAKASA